MSRLMKPLFCIIKTWEIVWNGYCTCSKLLYMLKWHFNAIFPSQIWWFWKKLVNIPILKVYAETQHVSNGNRKLPIVLSFDLSGNMWLYLLTYCQKCDFPYSSHILSFPPIVDLPEMWTRKCWVPQSFMLEMYSIGPQHLETAGC